MSEEREASRRELMLRAYAAYNARDVEALSACVTDDIDWSDGEHQMHGKSTLRAYWAD